MKSELWQIPAEYGRSTDEAQLEERRWALLSAEGDAVAFRRLVERHHRGVYQFVLRIVGSEADAEELAQETFARAFIHIGRFDPTYRLSTWLYRIALNLSRDHLRSAKRRERPYEPGSAMLDSGQCSPDPDLLVAAQYEARRLDRALATLPDSYREVLILKDLEDFSFQEIAQITRCSIAGLKIRAVRARAAMRKQLERMP
ncbi:MAG: RNA polymerase sigma factor [Polyangiales bacterium]|nr:RNA polymerase sigma factor [Myxococcales bacterium]MCB9658804.1 RNA polymerase sigma factor [Sandaracinaceae bacterium]